MGNTLLSNLAVDDVASRTTGAGLGNGTGQVLRQQVYLAPIDPGSVFQDAGGSNVGVAGGAVTATMPAIANKTNYLHGFSITGDAVLAAVIGATATLTGLAVGTLNFRIMPLTGAVLALAREFDRPLAASGSNQAITLSIPAIASGPIIAAEIHGQVG